MAVELAVGYVGLVVDASKVPGQIDNAIRAGARGADSVGKGIGSRMASGIGSALKAGVATAGLAAGALIGTALTKGFGRLTAIDDAQGKLRGLGHDAQAITTIMDSALASVKGTAFGLGDAATIAASAVAAGIAPGEELTRYLTLTADAATIAGTSLADMGSILNKATTSGKVFTDDLNQLSDRGIPIFQWLQKEYGVSAEALSKMVQDGKVDAATYRKVIQENIGGAAQESGSTIRGAWANVGAALGRVGEAALKPFSDMMKGSMGTATEWADRIAPKVEAAATKVATGLLELGRAFQSNGASIEGSASAYEKFGVKARGVVDRIKELWSAFRVDGMSGLWAEIKDGADRATGGLRSVEDVGSSMSGAFSKVAAAAAAIGVSLVSLTGDTGTVVAQGIRGIGSAMKFLADNSGAATAAMVGFASAVVIAKTVHVAYEASRVAQAIMMPADIASRIALTRAITAQTAVMRAHITALGGEAPIQALNTRQRIAAAAARAREAIATSAATSALGQYAAAQRVAAASSAGLAASMHTTAAAAATMGSRVQGAATASLMGFRSAAAGVAGLLGGPMGLALAGVGTAVIGHIGAANQAKRIHESLAAAVVQGAKAQNDFTAAVSGANGALDTNAMESATKVIEANLARITAFGEGQHWWDDMRKSFGDNQFLGDVAGFDIGDWIGGAESYDRVQRAIEQNQTLEDTLRDLKLEMSDLGPIVAAGGAEYDQLIARLESTGDAGADVVGILRQTRTELQSAADAVRNSTPGFFDVAAAVRVLADESSTASEKLDAMRSALDSLTGRQTTATDALATYHAQLRTVNDELDGLDLAGALGADGRIDATTEAGKKLWDMLGTQVDKFAEAAITGNDFNETMAGMEGLFGRIATEANLSAEQIAELKNQVGYLPGTIEMLATLEGTGDVEQKLASIAAMITTHSEGFEIPAELLDGDVRARLDEIGVHLTDIDKNGNPFIKVSAPDAAGVLAELEKIAQTKLPDKTQRINVTYQEATASGEWRAPMVLPRNATGGTIQGPGTGTSDSILGIDRATGVPTSWVSRGEEVISERSATKWRGLLKMINRDDPALRGLPAFAEGGTVPTGVSAALSKLRSITGTPYGWGGTGPNSWDCSGVTGYVQQLLMGIASPFGRLYTTYSLLDGALAGLSRGLGPAGTWFRVGVNREHMASTLAGQPVESGGSHGTTRIGAPAVGATDAQFTNHFHLPNSFIKGIAAAGTSADADGWTEEDQLKLDEAYLDVEEAKAARAKVYEDTESTDIQKRRADMRVRQAEQSVVKIQEEKDEKASAVVDDSVPAAPPLKKRYTDEESELERANLAVTSAEQKRNQTYADPESTDADLKLADLDYSDAMSARDELLQGAKESLAGSIADRVKQFGSEVFGLAVDTVRDEVPFGIGRSRWLDIAIPDFENHTPAADSILGRARAQSYPRDEVDGQLPVTTDGDPSALAPYIASAPPAVSEWIERLQSLKVFDQGGWLEPGEMAINLSRRPEPVLSSPGQMQQFMGGDLMPASTPNDFSVHMHNPQFTDGKAMFRAVDARQERQMMRHAGRPFR
ncbi:tape measure protein [Nocardia mangyaensis]|uniref:tape measure protein n=1 Tax=Nocardia mangyaensis TaxID=2213200 RepID=UPI0026758D56|nr:tape measure protein [Nocardia mangyaensis]MDO3647682.1 tape measure protein [Nocardia mangyaensis]